MKAVLRVDVQFLSTVAVIDVFVDIRRAESSLWSVVQSQIRVDGNGGVFQSQMRRLVLVVIRAGAREIRQQIEADHIIRLGIFDFLTFRSLLESLVVFVVLEGERLLASRDEPIQARIDNEASEAVVGVRWSDVSDLVKFLIYPRLPDAVLIIGDEQTLLRFRFLHECLESSLSRQHARLHGSVRSFDFRDIQKASRAANQRTAWEGEFRNRLVAAFIQGAGAIRNRPSAFKVRSHQRMVLQGLEFR